MRKLITMTPAQVALADEMMEETLQTNYTGLLVFLMLNYKQREIKRPVGRPSSKGNRRDDDADDDDDVARYQCPDYPLTKSRYTKSEVDAWYDFRGEAVPAGAYRIHPDYKGN